MINSFVALDIETTGLNPAEDKIIELGMAKVQDGSIVDSYSTLINPNIILDQRIIELTGITQEMLAGKPVIADIIQEVIDFIGDLPLLGHNIIFDYSFIKKAAVNNKLKFDKSGIDTLKIARRLVPEAENRRLSYLCEYFSIDAGNSHRAYDDAISAMQLYYRMYGINPNDTGFTELTELNYSVKKDTPITPAQKKYLTALVTLHNVELKEDIETLTKSRASKLIDGIISEYGR